MNHRSLLTTARRKNVATPPNSFTSTTPVFAKRLISYFRHYTGTTSLTSISLEHTYDTARRIAYL